MTSLGNLCNKREMCVKIHFDNLWRPVENKVWLYGNDGHLTRYCPIFGTGTFPEKFRFICLSLRKFWIVWLNDSLLGNSRAFGVSENFLKELLPFYSIPPQEFPQLRWNIERTLIHNQWKKLPRSAILPGDRFRLCC